MQSLGRSLSPITLPGCRIIVPPSTINNKDILETTELIRTISDLFGRLIRINATVIDHLLSDGSDNVSIGVLYDERLYDESRLGVGSVHQR